MARGADRITVLINGLDIRIIHSTTGEMLKNYTSTQPSITKF
jgi:hypothetical protein